MANVKDLEVSERESSDVGSSMALLAVREETWPENLSEAPGSGPVAPVAAMNSRSLFKPVTLFQVGALLALVGIVVVVVCGRVASVAGAAHSQDIGHRLNADALADARAKAAAAEAAAAALNAKNARIAAEAKKHAKEVAAKNKAIAAKAAAKNHAKGSAGSASPAPAAHANSSAAAPECHTANPGEPCYGSVLWHKWIGLVESPQTYGDSGLSRESNRHAIQEWLWKTKQSQCQKPCGGAYPVPTAAPKASPLLYCFSVARGGPEMDSMFMQRQSGTGIFGCNGFDVYSDQSINIDGYMTKLIPSTTAGVSVDGWAANSQVFMKTWMDILYGNIWYNYDFIAKVDPDAILFADRLRWHVQSHTGQNVFFLNCAVHAPAMYGAVEVFSKSSMGSYKAQHARCQSSLPFWAWGEDRFMQECLKMLGVVPISDYTNNVRDARCWGSDCGNKEPWHSIRSRQSTAGIVAIWRLHDH